jgi:DNA polymerase III alpha subunit (gram-positive type)
MINENQIFVVVDIENDGPAVGLNSMLSLAAVATTPQKEIARFYRKLQPLQDAKRDPDTTSWWNKHPEAWQEVNTDAEPASKVIIDFYNWVMELGLEPIFVSNPIGLDYTFVSWYLFQFAPDNPFIGEKNDIRTLDIRSYVAGKFNFTYDNSSRLKWPTWLIEDMPKHTHKAIDDAAGYAFILRKIIKK